MGKDQQEYRAKRNIPIRIAAVLFCLTLFSTYLVTGLFARYTTSVQSSDQARVAAFSIKGEGALSQTIAAELVPGGSQDVILKIRNDSEVAVEYKIEVTNETKNLPLSFSQKKENGSFSALAADGITFTDQQIPGTHTDTYTLHILWPKGSKDLDLMGMVDYITVKVTAVQID